MSLRPEALQRFGQKLPIDFSRLPLNGVAVPFQNLPGFPRIINLGDPYAIREAIEAIFRNKADQAEQILARENQVYQHPVAEVRDNKGELVTSFITVGGKPIHDSGKAPTSYQRCLLGIGAAFVTAASVIPLASVLDQKHAIAKEPNFPDQDPKKPLTGNDSSYTVEDLQVYGGYKIALLVTKSDGQYVTTGDINGLTNRAKIPFLGAAVFAYDDGTIQGALGSEAPGVNLGRFGLLENGKSPQVFENGEGSITDGAVTPDKSGVIIRAGNTAVGETQYLYQYFDLNTKTFTRLNLCAGCVPGSVGFPLTLVSPNISSSYGSGFPDRGYMESIFDTAARTVTTNNWHPEEGYNRSKRLNHFYNPANEHIVWMVNSDTLDPTGIRALGTLHYNANNVYLSAKDFQPKVPLYSEANALGRLNSIMIEAAAADIVGNWGYAFTAVNVNNILFPHIEAFSLVSPADLSQRFLVPDDGDLPPGWPNGGMHGDPGQFLAVLNEGAERYLLRDLRVDQAVYNGLYARRITNGITVYDQWRKVTISGGYTLWLPVVKNTN